MTNHQATLPKPISFTWFIALCVWLSILSCENNPFSKSIKEGVISYDITYPEISEDNVMLDLMPKKMETAFKDNSFRSDIIAGMGLFKTSIIWEMENETLTQSVKMLSKKYASELKIEDIEMLNPSLANISIEYTDKTKEIAGLECKEAIIHKEGMPSFSIYYTEKIKINSPNKGTPFKEIPGVLMEYDMINYNTHMHFVANKVEESIIQKDDLKLEDDYSIVSVNELQREIQSIFDKVND